MVLVGRDGREFRLGEDEGAKVFRARRVLGALVDVDDVKPRLVAVHRVQNDLRADRRV